MEQIQITGYKVTEEIICFAVSQYGAPWLHLANNESQLNSTQYNC